MIDNVMEYLQGTDRSTLILAVATLLASVLIVFSEYVKRVFESRKNRKKLKLWDEIYNAKGKDFTDSCEVLYELLKDQTVELEVLNGSDGTIVRAYAKGHKIDT